MATLREWLTEAGFDFKNGRIAYQALKEGRYPGWASGDELEVTKLISATDPLLDEDFSSSYGASACPRIIAEDDTGLYFPAQYDGSTELVKVDKFDSYLGNNKPTPYPGH